MMANRMVHLIGLGTMVISLLILGAFLLLFVNVNDWIQGWGSSLTMSVYLKEDVDKAEKAEVAKKIEELESAEIKRFISKDSALNELKNALGPQAGLLEGLSQNPLPASFEVEFRETGEGTKPETVKDRLEKLGGVEEVQYSEEWLERFRGLVDLIRVLGFVIGALLCLGALFIVTNTIKLAIYSRKEEIEVLKLVGATDWFVKIPFLMEGMIQGAVSAILALGILFGGYLVLSAEKMYLLRFAMLKFSFIPKEYVVGILLLGTGLGLIGSFIAVGRFFEI